MTVQCVVLNLILAVVLVKFKERENKAELKRWIQAKAQAEREEVNQWLTVNQDRLVRAGFDQFQVETLHADENTQRAIIKSVCLESEWSNKLISQRKRASITEVANEPSQALSREAAESIERMRQIFQDALDFKGCEAPAKVLYQRARDYYDEHGDLYDLFPESY